MIHGRFLTFWPDVFEPRPRSLEVSCSCGISLRDGPAAALSGWSAAPLSGPPACCRSARCRSCRCAHPRRGVPSPAARSGQHDKVRRALCKCHYGVLLSPAAILLTAGTWSGIPAAKLLKKCGRRPISSLDRVAGRSNLLKFCGPLQVLGNVLDSMRTCFLLEAHFCISRGETPGKRLHDSARRPSNFVPAGQGLRGRKTSFGTSKT